MQCTEQQQQQQFEHTAKYNNGTGYNTLDMTDKIRKYRNGRPHGYLYGCCPVTPQGQAKDLKKLGSSWRGSEPRIVDAAHCQEVGGCFYNLREHGNECYTVKETGE